MVLFANASCFLPVSGFCLPDICIPSSKNIWFDHSISRIPRTPSESQWKTRKTFEVGLGPLLHLQMPCLAKHSLIMSNTLRTDTCFTSASKGLATGPLVGIAAGAGVSILVIAVAAYLLGCSRKSKRMPIVEVSRTNYNSGTTSELGIR